MSADEREGYLRLVTEPETSEPVLIQLFEIEDDKGNVVPYFIEERPRVNVSLKYLRLVRQESESYAIAYLLEEMLGEDGFEALTEWKQLTKEQFDAIVKIAQRVALKDMTGEEPSSRGKGKGNKRKSLGR